MYFYCCDCLVSLNGRGWWFFESFKGRLECVYEIGVFVWLIWKDRILERVIGCIYFFLCFFLWFLLLVVMLLFDEDEEYWCEGMFFCFGD